MQGWSDDSKDEFDENTPEQKRKRKFGLGGQDAHDSDASNAFSAKSLSLRPLSSSSSVPSMGKSYDRQVSQGSVSVRNRFNGSNKEVREEKVNTSHSCFVLPYSTSASMSIDNLATNIF